MRIARIRQIPRNCGMRIHRATGSIVIALLSMTALSGL